MPDNVINIEPHWAGLRRWALHALLHQGLDASERQTFENILAMCEKARLADRPNTDWHPEIDQ